MPSELLVAMTSIDSGTGDSLTDVTSMDTTPVNDSLVDLNIVETNNNDSLVVNDSSVQFVLDGQPQTKTNVRKHINNHKMFLQDAYYNYLQFYHREKRSLWRQEPQEQITLTRTWLGKKPTEMS